MTIDRTTAHHTVFIFGLAVLVVGLSVSLFLASLGGMILSANWLAEGRYFKKLQRLKGNGSALWLMVLFALHFIWIWNTDNVEYGWKDIRIKLPLLYLPVVLGSHPGISRKVLFRLMWLFTASVATGTILALGHYFTSFNPATDNIRSIVFFSSPIRFALLVDLSLLFIAYNVVTRRISWWVGTIVALWFSGFLMLLQSLTGLLILALLIMVFVIFHGYFRVSGRARLIWYVAPTLLVLSGFLLLIVGFENYRTPSKPFEGSSTLQKYSAGGEPYLHYTENTEIQDGHFIYRNIAMEELERCWGRVSEQDFWGKDERGQPLRFTLIRFMTSLNLKKDSVGFQNLTSESISQIEQGFPSANPPANPLTRRLEETYFELNSYLNGASGQGSSVVQRLIYVQTGWEIVKDNWLTGVGTGDVNDAFQKKYDQIDSELDDDYRRRAHNQYLTFWITFGLAGALFFVLFNLRTIMVAGRNANFMALGFSVVAALSFLTEDTLETQVGATLFALFYALFFCLKVSDSTGQQFRFDEIWRNPLD